MPFDHDDPYVTIDCKILKATDKAVQIEDEHGTRVWVPRSCCHGADDVRIDASIGDDVRMNIRRWFASKEGLV